MHSDCSIKGGPLHVKDHLGLFDRVADLSAAFQGCRDYKNLTPLILNWKQTGKAPHGGREPVERPSHNRSQVLLWIQSIFAQIERCPRPRCNNMLKTAPKSAWSCGKLSKTLSIDRVFDNLAQLHALIRVCKGVVIVTKRSNLNMNHE